MNDQVSQTHSVNIGVPQSSILGPRHFNIYANDLVNIDRDLHYVIYADDTTLFLSYKFDLACNDNIVLEKYKWSVENGHSLNSSKTEGVLFVVKKGKSL